MVRLIMTGQKLVTGLPGLEITDEFRQLVKQQKVGNVILFARNIESPSQLKNLCGELRELILKETGFPPFIAIDQEGGNLSRLYAPATVLPGAMGLAATGNSFYAYDAGRITATELLACGVNMNFAPVMDVNNNPDNPVIGARSFSSDPAMAAEFGCAMAKGLRDAGVIECVKHFPGHGDTQVDSHLSLPVIDKSLDELRRCELIPFARAVQEGVQAVMTAHILFPQLEQENVPATMSPFILQGLLRKELQFEGLIISDCMMMEAISGHYGTVEGTVAACKAGVDLVLICHSNVLTAEASKALMERLPQQELETSFGRILNAKRRIGQSIHSLESVGCPEHRFLAKEMAQSSPTFVGGPSPKLPALGNNPLFVGCEPYRSTQAADPSSCGGNLPGRLQMRFGGVSVEIPSQPDRETISRVLSCAKEHSILVLSTFNGRQLEGQRRLIQSLKTLEMPVVLIAMRDPYDLMGMTDHCWCLAAYDYTDVSVDAICEVLDGKLEMTGKLPVKL